jgi:hypothetical protein
MFPAIQKQMAKKVAFNRWTEWRQGGQKILA